MSKQDRGRKAKNMSVGGDTAREDLAYLRTLVGEDTRTRAGAGAAFLWSGLIYGFQCLVLWAQVEGFVHLSDVFMFWFIIGVSVVFAVGVIVIIVQGVRSGAQKQQGLAARAMNGVFAGVGIATAVMALVFGYAAARAHDLSIWLFHPIMVCLLQGVT